MKLTFPLLNTTINVPVDDAMAGGKKSRRELRRKKMENRQIDSIENLDKIGEKAEEGADINKLTESNEQVPKPVDDGEQVVDPATQSETVTQPLLMAEVVNVVHEKFRQTEEIKVDLNNYNFNTISILYTIDGLCEFRH